MTVKITKSIRASEAIPAEPVLSEEIPAETDGAAATEPSVGQKPPESGQPSAEEPVRVKPVPLDFAEASRELPTRIVTPRQIDASRKERREEAASDGTAPSVRVHAQTSAAKPLPKPLSDDDVTARTASMWKYLPVPEDQPEPYPETIQGTVDFPGSRIIAARVRGKMHKHEGTNCDDWYELAHLDRITFAAVSDGAGSRMFSRIGARESCKAAVGALVKGFEELFADNPDVKEDVTLPLEDSRCMDACGKLAGIVQQSVVKAYEAVESAFEERRNDPAYRKALGREPEFRDFSGTLLIAVLIPVCRETKEHLVITCQIGDGMIAILNSKGDFAGSVKLMGVPDSGEYSGQTEFLTSEKMKKIETLQCRTMISRTIVDTVMLMSDGVADDYFPNETQIRRLYFDLIVNGILDRETDDIAISEIPREQMNLFKRVPDPMVYPWVNDRSVMVPIQYTSRIMEATGLSLEDLWKDRTILALARHELVKADKCADPGERLRTWLDNYVERGSFDDRTLVIVTM
jgi:hypothetical protein